MFPGKDARLYVFRLRALKRGIEEKQLVRSKCDSRENKLEKTKGEALTNESHPMRKAGDACIDVSHSARMRECVCCAAISHVQQCSDIIPDNSYTEKGNRSRTCLVSVLTGNKWRPSEDGSILLMSRCHDITFNKHAGAFIIQ